ncbi:MAG TPA: EcsC family protein [Rubricoccaceae bacterium]|nr:EcsC family protein [Rubricoccaceae bacterium]
MRLTDYERDVQREIERWERGGRDGLLQQVLGLAMRPVDWAFDQFVPESVIDGLTEALNAGLGTLNDASEWTYDHEDLLEKARAAGMEVENVEALRDQPLENLDALARSLVSQNALMASLSGGGAGLGGFLFAAADVPILFTINFRLIQQIGAAYGFAMRGPAFKPLVLAIFNVAASGSRQAKSDALRELSVAAAAFAHGSGYRGRSAPGTFREQVGHLPREIAKNLAMRKLGQLIPVAGVAVGAGVNYWFTDQTAEAALMLFRALYLERKERL